MSTSTQSYQEQMPVANPEAIVLARACDRTDSIGKRTSESLLAHSDITDTPLLVNSNKVELELPLNAVTIEREA